jgi:cytosine deaminase
VDSFLNEAFEEARKGLSEGGIPIGSVLVIDGKIVGRGHNRRIQDSSPILHAEMACLESAGRLSAEAYRRATLYSTLSPCDMCSGAILLYKIPTVVIGENRTFAGPEDYLRSRGVTIHILNDDRCYEILLGFRRAKPKEWDEDIGLSASDGPSGTEVS